MKSVRLPLITLIVLLFNFQSKAQETLPYYSGFDTQEQKDGWTEYKTAATQFSHWGDGGFNAYSDPNCISHDYSPSTGIDLTDNWYVSPGFSISNGGKLDSIRYSFSGFSVPDTGDTIAIYLLNGSQDPTLASKTLLFDFRDNEYQTDNVYRIKTDIILPPKSGLSYFAVRYRNTDCSTKWLTVFFDNISISGVTLGVNENLNEDDVSIYPNPSNGKFRINHTNDVTSISVNDYTGKAVHYSSNVNNHTVTEIDLSDEPKGIYIISIRRNKGLSTRKIVLK
jgi:hypothetical protein